MINLIPSTVRKAIIKEYWVRVLSLFLFVLSVVAVIISLLFLPVYVLVSTQTNIYAESTKQAEERMADFNVSAKALTDANLLAQKILEQKKIKNFSEVISLVESLALGGVSLNTLELNREAEGVVSVRVDGLADTRNDLAAFRDRLLEDEEIEDVILPISNLAKDKDIQFTLSIVLKKNIE